MLCGATMRGIYIALITHGATLGGLCFVWLFLVVEYIYFLVKGLLVFPCLTTTRPRQKIGGVITVSSLFFFLFFFFGVFYFWFFFFFSFLFFPFCSSFPFFFVELNFELISYLMVLCCFFPNIVPAIKLKGEKKILFSSLP